MKAAIIAAVVLSLIAFFVCWTSHSPRKTNPSTASDERGSNTQGLPLFTSGNNETADEHKKSTQAKSPHWYETPEWWLVIAAIPTLIFVGWQARATSVSAAAAKEAAKAALLNAQAVINSERAWIEAELIQKTTIGVTRYDLEITNHGKTPARLSHYEINYGFPKDDGTWSLETLDRKDTRNLRFFLGSDKTIKVRDFNMEDMFASLRNPPPNIGFLCFTINYADVVSVETKDREGHKTSFVYQYNVLLGSLERISIFTQYT
jgi:hypothetical protein